MLSTEDTIRTVIDRTNGIVERNMSKRACKESGISFDNHGNIKISEKADETLNNLIKNLVNEGGVIAKITLHNLAIEKGLNFDL